MRWDEIVHGSSLLEGATIHPSEIKNAGTDNEYHTWPEHLAGKQDLPCDLCDGTGDDPHGPSGKCPYCKGKGTYEEDKWDFPSLSVAYANLHAIMDMLGLEDAGDSSGIIWNKDIPAVKRQIILLKNKGSAQFTKEPSDTQDRVVSTNDQGITQIGRGARMVDLGRSQAQIEQYLDKMMEILNFAQEHNMNVSWA